MRHHTLSHTLTPLTAYISLPRCFAFTFKTRYPFQSLPFLTYVTFIPGPEPVAFPAPQIKSEAEPNAVSKPRLTFTTLTKSTLFVVSKTHAAPPRSSTSQSAAKPFPLPTGWASVKLQGAAGNA